jgi:hypothetical protein
MVQSILYACESDEVDSIDDTPEALLVVNIIKSTYDDLMADRNWKHQRSNIVVAPYGIAKPTHVKLPDDIKEVVFINYDKRKTPDERLRFEEVKYLDTDAFLRILNARDSTADNIQTIEDFSGMKLLIKNDAAPTYYTSFDETYLVFDSYNSDIDDTIVASKIQSEGYIFREWENTDEFIPDLPAEMFALLLNTAKREAFVVLKQTDNPIYATRERRQRRAMSMREWNVAKGNLYPDYGRKGRR